MKIAIVGGGITGLAAAHRIGELNPGLKIDLFEATDRPGGVLHTERQGDFLVEHSADMFTTMDDAALKLCERLGIADDLIGTNEGFQKAFILQQNELVPVPPGLNLMSPSDLDAIRQTPLLSDEGKQRFLEEENVPAKPEYSDESLFDFATRRFGIEAYEKIIQPLVGGIYTADPKKLSMRATLDRYLQMEQKFGSVIRAVAQNKQARESKQTSGARYNLFVAPRLGMKSLINRLREQIPDNSIHFDTPVSRIEKRGSEWVLEVDGKAHEYSAVILTCPPDIAAKLIEPIDKDLSEALKQITCASSAIVVQGFERAQVGHALDGFGFVVPLVEKRKILAGSFSSVKFSGRAADEHVLMRSFVGGACQPELLQHNDQEVTNIVNEELQSILKIDGQPLFEKVVRWNNSMPQYHVGHVDLVANIEQQVQGIPGLAIAGKAYKGVGIPACVASAENAAEAILSSEI